jgi:hypothetical protein
MEWRDKTRGVMDACKSAFGESIVYTPINGSPIELIAIIDEAFEAVDPNVDAIIISQQPMIGIKIDDLPSEPQKGDLVTMRGKDFKVIEAQTDGQAGTKLLLHKVVS